MSDDLFEILDTKHPDWLAAQPTWELFRDVLGDAEVEKEKYLPRGKDEIDPLYRLRVALSQFIPESPLAIQKILHGLFRETPVRNYKDAKLEKWTDDVDKDGTKWSKFVEQLAEQILGYGTLRLLVNMKSAVPSVEGQKPSRADELQQNVRPFLVLYSPLSVIDWEVDADGVIQMVMIKETRTEKAPPPTHHVEVTRFVRYTATTMSWWEFAKTDKGFELRGAVEDVEHGLGVVPMVVDYFPKKVKPLVGSGYIRFAARADIQKYQAESDLQWNSHLHAHPTFWAKVKDSLSSIGIGSTAFIKLNPDAGEEVGYVDVPSASFDALQGLIDEKRAVIFRQVGTDPLGILNSGQSTFQASGVSRAWSFGTSESKVLRAIADRMESVERSVLEIVSRYLSEKTYGLGENAFGGEVKYPDEYDISATQTLLDQTEQTAQMVNSETLIKALHQRLASSLVGDTTPKTLKQIHDEIEDNDLIGTPVGKPQADPTLMPPTVVPHDPGAADEETGEVDPVSNSRSDDRGGTPAKRRRPANSRK